jgi:hypothetical protein
VHVCINSLGYMLSKFPAFISNATTLLPTDQAIVLPLALDLVFLVAGFQSFCQAKVGTTQICPWHALALSIRAYAMLVVKSLLQSMPDLLQHPKALHIA